MLSPVRSNFLKPHLSGMNSPAVPELATLLMGLPAWQRVADRHAFVDDVLWQIGAADDALAQADPSTAAAAVAARCAGGAALAVLCESIADRGWMPPDALPQTGPTDAAGAPYHGAPYPGPRPFRADEALYFCGRGYETRTLLRRIAAPRPLSLTLLAGRCGSGRTSLIQAGVVAALRAGAVRGLSGTNGWVITSMRPGGTGDNPFEALAAAVGPASPAALAAAERLRDAPDGIGVLAAALLADAPGGAEWLLLVDDLDELFRPACGAGARTFLDLLWQAAELPRVRVLGALRSDHLDACVEHPGLSAALNGGGLCTLAMPSATLLERMITGPLARLRRPPALGQEQVRQLVAETRDQPAALLYLAGRLPELYVHALNRGQASPGTSSAVPPGSVPGAGAGGGSAAFFAGRAERALERADDPGGGALPGVFAQLVRVGSGTLGEPCIGAGAPLGAWHADDRARAVIGALAAPDIGLLAVDAAPAPRVRVAHGALLDAWPRLRAWVEDRRAAGALVERIRREAADWQEQGCPERLRWSHELLDPARRLLAATGLLDALERDPAVADFLTPEAERLLAEVFCGGTGDARREDIGLRLARIGDPRPGVLPEDGCPRPRWCAIPGGRVLIDGRHEVLVTPFRLAAYPVTRAQFDAFLTAADGFDNPAWWRGLQRRPMDGFGRGRRGNEPATGVSWHDATAFCRWLGARLGHAVRLPAEAEWQWAAQSARSDFVYPWGSDWLPLCANTDESGIGRCIAVGLYPAGESRQGVHDLAGNTWEWCLGPFNPGAAEPGAARVVRGGSWRVNRGFARADFRLDAMPEDRVGSTGFRVACDLGDGA